MEDRTSEQLSGLPAASDLLERGGGIDYWLFGGWAVDFYAAFVTRAHDDLDMAVWLDDLPRIAELLHDDGWRHARRGGEGSRRFRQLRCSRSPAA